MKIIQLKEEISQLLGAHKKFVSISVWISFYVQKKLTSMKLNCHYFQWFFSMFSTIFFLLFPLYIFIFFGIEKGQSPKEKKIKQLNKHS